jgi:hypothetical protein
MCHLLVDLAKGQAYVGVAVAIGWQDRQRASWGYRPANLSWGRGTQGASSQPTRSRFAEIRAATRSGPDGYGSSQNGSSAPSNE